MSTPGDFPADKGKAQLGSSTLSTTSTSSAFKLLIGWKPINIILDNVKELTGQEHYEDWAAKMKIIFDSIQALNIIVEGT